MAVATSAAVRLAREPEVTPRRTPHSVPVRAGALPARLGSSFGSRQTGSLGPPARTALRAPRVSLHDFRPSVRTSGMSRAPVSVQTADRASSISACTSAAVASPRFEMKFACKVEIWAPPIRRPLSPADSISRPAKSPGRISENGSAGGNVQGLGLGPFVQEALYFGADLVGARDRDVEQSRQEQRSGCQTAQRAVDETQCVAPEMPDAAARRGPSPPLPEPRPSFRARVFPHSSRAIPRRFRASPLRTRDPPDRACSRSW